MRKLASVLNGMLLRVAATVTFALAMTFASAGSADAHDQGTLKLASKTFRADDSLTVIGSKFSKNDEVALFLVGVSGRVPLGDIPTDTAGGFRRVLLVPASTPSGQYRMIAEAVDGDIVSGLDVVVLAAAAVATTMAMPAMPGMEGMPGHEGMNMDPTGEALSLTRARSTAVTSTAIVLIIVFAAVGAGLMRRPPAIPLEEQS